MISLRQFLALVLSSAIVLVTIPRESMASAAVQPTAQPAVQPAHVTPEHLQQLVAPIALYPDELVAQVLAAATYPTEIVEANRWLQENSSLKDAQLADAVDKQSWDPSVKALTQFPSVLANMDKNLSWASALGDAYFNQSQDVLDAVQVMRKRAQSAGTLKTTAQETVTTKDQTVIIEPANPEIVYLPEYDPWIVYGAPLLAYPGYFDAGFFVGGPFIFFDEGFPIRRHIHHHWGWHNWGCNWRDRFVVFNHNRFISRSHTFINRRDGIRGGEGFRGARPPSFPGRAEGNRGGAIDHRADRGFAAPRMEPNQRPGAFSGFDHGGVANQHSFRGQSSFGGGMHGGGVAGGAPGGFRGGTHGGSAGGAPGGFGGGTHGGGGGHR